MYKFRTNDTKHFNGVFKGFNKNLEWKLVDYLSDYNIIFLGAGVFIRFSDSECRFCPIPLITRQSRVAPTSGTPFTNMD